MKLKLQEADVRHTAEDLEEKEIDKFFDIELNADQKHTNGVLNGKTKGSDLAHINVGFVDNEKNGKVLSTHM